MLIELSVFLTFLLVYAILAFEDFNSALENDEAIGKISLIATILFILLNILYLYIANKFIFTIPVVTALVTWIMLYLIYYLYSKKEPLSIADFLMILLLSFHFASLLQFYIFLIINAIIVHIFFKDKANFPMFFSTFISFSFSYIFLCLF